MSETISLVVLRFEIAGNKEAPEFINYTAPNFVLTEEVKVDLKAKQTYASVAGNTANKSCDLDIIRECQGNRKVTEIVVESYNYELLEETSTATMTSEPRKSLSPQSSREGSVSSRSSLSSAAGGKSEAYFRPIDPSEDGPGPSPSQGHYDDEGPGPAPSPCSGNSSRPNSGNIRPKSQSPASKFSPTVHFYSGNPMVERVEGILHLYKDNKLTPLTGDHPRSELICMLAVPGAYNVHDLIKFTEPVSEGIEYLRIIRGNTPNQYMVLVKFRSREQADEFYSTYNNTPYNSIEPDICHLVYVAKVETLKEAQGACLPTPGITELPCCPVCLEKMDESIKGVLTILCNHAFHMSCLFNWDDTRCPVCRYSQTPEDVSDSRCMKCGSQESLWICLICGHIGCGRYVELHAYKHFQETNHTYAMQLGHNQVWDYVGDNYVHRLIQSKGDGKLVQVEGGPSGLVQDEKVDSLNLEYTYLLTSQLESQRHYFEEKIKEVEKEAQDKVENLEIKNKQKYEEFDNMNQKLEEVMKEKNIFEKKLTHLHGRMTKALNELKEEQEMNKCLRANQKLWQEKVTLLEQHNKDLAENKEKEVKELNEQLRDVMFYFEAQQKLTETKEISQKEIQEGQVVVGATGSTPSPSHKRTRKKER